MKPAPSSPKILSHIKEIIFVGVLILAVSATAIAATFWPRELAGTVRVSLHGEEVTVLKLNVDQKYNLNTEHGTLVVEVKDRKAAIISSPCPNQLCVKEGFKGDAGQSIVCVPEEVSLTFLGAKEISEVDV